MLDILMMLLYYSSEIISFFLGGAIEILGEAKPPSPLPICAYDCM